MTDTSTNLCLRTGRQSSLKTGIWARGAWFEWSQTGCLTTIEVLDSGGGKGFS